MTIETDYARDVAVFPIEFRSDPEQDAKGELVLVDWVKWIKKGNPNHGGEDKITRLKKFQPDVWAVIEPFYNAWKKNEDMPVDGTPINVWPSISRKMADVLRMNGIQTVEDMANTTDADLVRIGLGASSLREKARHFVSLKSGQAKTASLLADRDKRISVLEEELKGLKLALQNNPKKRGRPPKEE